MKTKTRKKDALRYHQEPRPGKIEIRATKPCLTSRDLSLAYTPGVAHPCLEIARQEELAYRYTNKGNLVAVITNGTAVLGLGDLGPLGAKPVMEGKAVLFKRFADIDVFDLEFDTKDPDQFVDMVAAISPTFGGINLEDIKAPECFHIERALRERLDIPVMHDDQHGTAIITGAAFINALQIAEKQADQVRIVALGAGAAGIACLDMLIELGALVENILLVDSKGIIFEGREGITKEKSRFAAKTKARTLEDAMKGADVFLGLSKGNLVSPKMLLSMAENPIVFAMANPDPEIDYPVAKATRDDVIIATGRSDYPNQVNNVLGFPFIFRGALDVHARTINKEMKIAAAKSLALLARQEVTAQVRAAYSGAEISFGRDYIIPKPFDERVLYEVAPAVALAASQSGVARQPIDDLDAYRQELKGRLHPSGAVMRMVFDAVRQQQPKIVFPEGTEPNVVRAAECLADTGIAQLALIGPKEQVLAVAAAAEVDLESLNIEIIDPQHMENLEDLVSTLHTQRNRRGITKGFARSILLSDTNQLGALLVEDGRFDGMVTGLTRSYPHTLKPVLRCVGTQPPPNTLCAVSMVFKGSDVFFFADTTINVDPDARMLARIGRTVAKFVRKLNVEPRLAMLSFSNFGSARFPQSDKARDAAAIIREEEPELMVDGEMQFNVAFDAVLRERLYEFSHLKGAANVFIFPNLESSNIAYKMMQCLGEAEVVGPVLLGLNKPVHILQRESDVNSIVNLTALTAFQVEGDRGES